MGNLDNPELVRNCMIRSEYLSSIRTPCLGHFVVWREYWKARKSREKRLRCGEWGLWMGGNGEWDSDGQMDGMLGWLEELMGGVCTTCRC